jgi:hypothetical protein
MNVFCCLQKYEKTTEVPNIFAENHSPVRSMDKKPQRGYAAYGRNALGILRV